MTTRKRIVALILILCFTLNSATLFAIDFNNNDKTVLKVSAVEEEKERLKKKFTGMKDWFQDLKPNESFIANNQTFLKFRDDLSKFLSDIRRQIEEQWDEWFTTAL